MKRFFKIIIAIGLCFAFVKNVYASEFECTRSIYYENSKGVKTEILVKIVKNSKEYSITVGNHKQNVNYNATLVYTNYDCTPGGPTDVWCSVYINAENQKEIFESDTCPELYTHQSSYSAGSLSISAKKTDYYDNSVTPLPNEEDPHGGTWEYTNIDLDPTPMECTDILGPSLSQIVKGGITIIQIVAAIICIVKGMITVVPAVVAKDADALKKAGGTLVNLGIILALVLIFRPIIRIIGSLLGYDVTCIL